MLRTRDACAVARVAALEGIHLGSKLLVNVIVSGLSTHKRPNNFSGTSLSRWVGVTPPPPPSLKGRSCFVTMRWVGSRALREKENTDTEY